MANRRGKGEAVTDLFSWAAKSVDGDYSHEIKTLAPWTKNDDKPRQCIKKQRNHFAEKHPYSESYGSSNSQILIREMDHKTTEHRRIDAFKLWCWRRLLRVP